MPAPGEQYKSDNIKNPFDERTVSAFTASEIATLQSRLNRQLGPEFVSHRQGAGGSRVAYLEGTKAIALANDVFGFNGWSSSLQQVQIDYVDEGPNNRINLGLSIIVRVTLRDGTYHEDIGYGTIDNAKGKGAAFEKAKKEAATDGLKRALRNFGNVLGNCLYDKEYLKKISAMKAKPIKFDEGRLHRHPDFAPPPMKEEELVKKEKHMTPRRPDQPSRPEAPHSAGGVSLEAEDEFGGNLFDGMEISEHHGDEFTFDSVTTSNDATLSGSEGHKPTNGPSGAPTRPPGPGPGPGPNNGVAPPSMARVQSMPAMCPQNNVNQPPQQNQGPRNQGPGRPAPNNMNPPPQQNAAQNQGPGRPTPNNMNQPPQHNQAQHQGPVRPPVQANPQGPQTPMPQHTNPRPEMQRPRGPTPTVDIHAPPKPPAQPQQQQNQPLRPTPPQGQQAAPQRPSIGFTTGRAAKIVQDSDATTAVLNVAPAFNPNIDSPIPKEQRTPGIDHKRSMKITRESVGIPAPPQLQQQPAQPQAQQSQGFRPVAPASRPNFVNPHHDPNRRIGAPQGRPMSPLANRSAYKPPGMVGGVKRPPLADVSNHNGKEEGPESKKAKLGPAGAENNGGAAVSS